MMDQVQLELNLLATATDAKSCAVELEPSKVVSLEDVRAKKKQQKIAKVYESILESVEHLVSPDQRFK